MTRSNSENNRMNAERFMTRMLKKGADEFDSLNRDERQAVLNIIKLLYPKGLTKESASKSYEDNL